MRLLLTLLPAQFPSDPLAFHVVHEAWAACGLQLLVILVLWRSLGQNLLACMMLHGGPPTSLSD